MDQHRLILDQLADFSAGQLSDSKAARVRAHLIQCPTCSERSRELQEITRALNQAPESFVNPIVLRRITALATARRIEVLERRRLHRWVALFAFSMGFCFLVSLPVLSKFSVVLGERWHWSPTLAIATGLIAWGAVCWMMGISLIPILRMQKLNGKEKRS
jgi:anti-sigma factor RsiW